LRAVLFQVLNKAASGGFSRADEQLLAFFSQFAGLYLTNAARYDFLRASQESAMHLLDMQSSFGHIHPRFGIVVSTERRVASSMAIELTREEKQLVLTEHFDVLSDYGLGAKFDRLVPLVVWIFESLGLLESFRIPRPTLFRFLLTVASKYRAVPYHNFVHAFDATQTIVCFLLKGGVRQHLTDLDVFVVLVSSLMHDIDHMGLNNSFHTKTETPLGVLSTASGTTSVLEIHHCNLALEVLGLEQTGIFDSLGKEDKAAAYKTLISTILATDMAKHGNILQEWSRTCGPAYDRENVEHRRLAAAMLMKAADLSNLTKPFNTARLWAILVTTEWYEQGETEKAVGCSVTPNFDRETKPELAETQIGFMDGVGIGFYEAITAVFPGMTYALEQLRSNRARWGQVLAKTKESASARKPV